MRFAFFMILMFAGFLVSNLALASDDCSIEKQVAVAWIQGHLSIENEAFRSEFRYVSCTGEGYTEIVAVVFRSATTICAIDVDPKSYVVVSENRGCYPYPK
jgi:hypothetical protein